MPRILADPLPMARRLRAPRGSVLGGELPIHSIRDGISDCLRILAAERPGPKFGKRKDERDGAIRQVARRVAARQSGIAVEGAALWSAEDLTKSSRRASSGHRSGPQRRRAAPIAVRLP